MSQVEGDRLCDTRALESDIAQLRGWHRQGTENESLAVLDFTFTLFTPFYSCGCPAFGPNGDILPRSILRTMGTSGVRMHNSHEFVASFSRSDAFTKTPQFGVGSSRGAIFAVVRRCCSATLRRAQPFCLLDVDPRYCTSVLQQTTCLIHCGLSLWEGRPPPDVPIPSLESLALAFLDAPLLGYIESFNVPALRTLRITDDFLWDDPIGTLTSFISKSGCALGHLCIIGDRITPQACRNAFPAISKFTFKNGMDWDDLTRIHHSLDEEDSGSEAESSSDIESE